MIGTEPIEILTVISGTNIDDQNLQPASEI
jgi:hypothetical protein